MFTLCCDMDGVFADFVYGATLLGRELGYNKQVLTTRDVRIFQFMEEMYPPHQLEKLWKVIQESNRFWKTLPPASVDLGDFTLRKVLENPGARFFIVTSRRGDRVSVQEQTIQWFEHFMGITLKMDQVIVCKRHEKIRYLEDLKASAFIDDCSDTIEEVIEMGGVRKVYCMDYKFNRLVKDRLEGKVNWVKTVGEFFLELRNYLI